MSRQPIRRCVTRIRHWFTVYGEVGHKRAICGHCRMVHPDILKALQRGVYYARLYSPPGDSPDSEQDERQRERDIALLVAAIERIQNEPRR